MVRARVHWRCGFCRRDFATIGNIRDAQPCPYCGQAIPSDELAVLDEGLKALGGRQEREEAAAIANATLDQRAAMDEGREAYRLRERAADPMRFDILSCAMASPYTRGKMRTPTGQPMDSRHAFFVRGWRQEQDREPAPAQVYEQRYLGTFVNATEDEVERAKREAIP